MQEEILPILFKFSSYTALMHSSAFSAGALLITGKKHLLSYRGRQAFLKVNWIHHTIITSGMYDLEIHFPQFVNCLNLLSNDYANV